MSRVITPRVQDPGVRPTHSEKQNAAATFKRTFGFHPIGVWCDNTSEFLAAKLRAGNAGSNTTTDHIEVLTEAMAQIPGTHRKKLLIRSDGAGASHGLLDWLTEQGQIRGRSLEYSIGFAVTEKIARRSGWSRSRCGRPRRTRTAGCARVVTSPS